MFFATLKVFFFSHALFGEASLLWDNFSILKNRNLLLWFISRKNIVMLFRLFRGVNVLCKIKYIGNGTN